MKSTFKTIVLLALSPMVLQAQDGGTNEGNENSGGRSRGDLKVIGLTSDKRLICFNESSPDRAFNIGTVSGLVTDTALVGIDYRVQNGKLYGVGNAGGVYTLDTGNAAATLVNRLTVALTGTSFGVDFNPVADRLRIVGDDGQNLRHNVNVGGVTLVDGALNYTPGTPAATRVASDLVTYVDVEPITGRAFKIVLAPALRLASP